MSREMWILVYHATRTIRAIARHGVGRENANLSLSMGNLGSYRGTSSTEYDDSYTDDGVSLGRSHMPHPTNDVFGLVSDEASQLIAHKAQQKKKLFTHANLQCSRPLRIPDV
ncbi:Altered inheritance of mitochondria protein 41 [Fusarium oxysporum f. sp. albedinis]|nr:Altered inheritance of mitochondria protein 41 [Fusarium oxysporum f. sp. albedinis]